MRHVKTAPKDHSLAAQPATAPRRGNLPTRSSRKFDRSCAIVCIHTTVATGKVYEFVRQLLGPRRRIRRPSAIVQSAFRGALEGCNVLFLIVNRFGRPERRRADKTGEW